MPMKRSPPTRSPASSVPQGRDVRFQTGTDEHGLKMAQAARSEGIEPRAFADKMSPLFKADVRHA